MKNKSPIKWKKQLLSVSSLLAVTALTAFVVEQPTVSANEQVSIEKIALLAEEGAVEEPLVTEENVDTAVEETPVEADLPIAKATETQIEQPLVEATEPAIQTLAVTDVEPTEEPAVETATEPLTAIEPTAETPTIDAEVEPTAETEVTATAVTSDIIISEVVEGSSNNKAIELYNGTATDVDLNDYSLNLYANGGATPNNTTDLTGTLAQGDTYVLAHAQANDVIQNVADTTSSVANFNGDDLLTLTKNDVVIDSFGQFGVAEEWNKDVTISRNADVVAGDTDVNDAVDLTGWTALEKDNFANLGLVNTELPAEGDQPTEPTEPEEPAAELETISMADARNMAPGERVRVQGTVTARLKNTIHFEDSTGALAIYPVGATDAAVGDQVDVTGSLSEYNGLLQLQDVAINTVTPAIPLAATPLTGADINEGNESRLAELSDVTIAEIESESDSWTNYIVEDDGATYLLRDENNALNLEVGNTYESITGIIQEYSGEYQLIPRDTNDILLDSSITTTPTTNISAGTVASETEITLSSNTPDANIYYTLDGSTPTTASTRYTEPIILPEGDTLITAFAQADSLAASAIAEFAYSAYDAAEGIQIHDIQGDTHYSPMADQIVDQVDGIVTAVYQLGSNMYAHIQEPTASQDDNPHTSEAIVLYMGGASYAPDVNVGDHISATGRVDEYHIDGYYDSKADTDLPVTQINVRDDQGGSIRVLDTGVALPEAVVISSDLIPKAVSAGDDFQTFDPTQYALDFWEALEGMYVSVEDVRAVAPQEHSDIWTVSMSETPETVNGGVLLGDGNEQTGKIGFKPFATDGEGDPEDFNVITGDEFIGTINGVVMYDFSNYRIYTDLAHMQSIYQPGGTTPDTQSDLGLDEDPATITIASYNLENYSANASSGETSEEKAQRLANAIGNVLNTPDIVGLTEVQDNNGGDAGDTAANQSYERLIDDIAALTGVTYEYINVDPIAGQDGGAPNANIRVGFLYNPATVSLKTTNGVGDATTDVRYVDGSLNVSAGRIDPTNPAFDNSRKPLAAQFVVNATGDEVVVVINHWNSKGGDTPIYGSSQPADLPSVEQRIGQATAVANFVDDVKTDNPDANIVLLGDFNDFQWTEALQTVEGEHLYNMIYDIPVEERYSYTYNGNSQVLDHILVSNNLKANTAVDMVKINADFTDMAGRASDHDPLMIEIDFNAAVVPPVLSESYGPTATNITITEGDTLPAAVSAISNLVDLPTDVTVDWLETTEISAAGTYPTTLRVTYADSSFDDVLVDIAVEAAEVPIETPEEPAEELPVETPVEEVPVEELPVETPIEEESIEEIPVEIISEEAPIETEQVVATETANNNAETESEDAELIEAGVATVPAFVYLGSLFSGIALVLLSFIKRPKK